MKALLVKTGLLSALLFAMADSAVAGELGEMLNSEPVVYDFPSDEDGSAVVLSSELLGSSYLVGEIACKDGVTQTGGKFYTIPIEYADYCKFMNPVSLVYDSQSQMSDAGYRWGIGGVSAIEVVNKTSHYDELVVPADLSDTSTCAFAIDGVRLISTGIDDFESASSFIKATAIRTNGKVTGFNVRYPNGSTAVFASTRTDGMDCIFPIREMRNLQGYGVFYQYRASGNRSYLQEVDYGGKDEDSCIGKIEFSYGASEVVSTKYVCGMKVSQSLRLNGIRSSVKTLDGWKELRSYHLVHDGDLLREVHSSVGKEELPPLTFGYSRDKGDGIRLSAERTLFGNAPEKLPQHTLLVRGKFLPGEYEDGMVIVTKEYSPYQMKSDGTFGSTMPENEDIYVYTGTTLKSTPFSVKAGKGFQSVSVADINGDGVDEIVTVNSYLSGKTTVIDINAYAAEFDGSYSKNTYSCSVTEHFDDGNGNVSAARTVPYCGDFNGDGIMDILVAVYPEPSSSNPEYYFANFAMPPYRLEKMDSQIAPLAEYDKMLCMDADGDGMTEIYVVSGRTMHKYVKQWDRLVLNRNIALPVDFKYHNDIFWGDLNSDGKLDMLVPKAISYLDTRVVEFPVWAPHKCPECGGYEPIIGNAEQCRYCGHDLLSYYVKNGGECRICGKMLEAVSNPLNSGRFILECPKHEDVRISEALNNYVDNGGSWIVGMSTGCGFDFTEMEIGNYENVGVCAFADINNDMLCDALLDRNGTLYAILNKNGILDFKNAAQVERRYVGNRLVMPANNNNFGASGFIALQKEESELKAVCYNAEDDKQYRGLATLFVNSLGLVSSNDYSDLTKKTVYDQQNWTACPEEMPMIAPITVVMRSTKIDKARADVECMEYHYNEAAYNRRGLGFRGFKKVSMLDKLSGDTAIVEYEDIDRPVRQILRSADARLSYVKLGNRGGAFEDYAVKKSIVTDKSTGVESLTEYTYDIYGNVTKSEKRFSSNPKLVETTETDYLDINNSERFATGIVAERKTTNSRSGDVWMRKEMYEYDKESYLPVCETVTAGVDGSNSVVKTTWTYDSFGNVLKEASSPYDSGLETLKTYTYSSDGLFMESETDEKGVTTKFSDFNIFGRPEKITSCRNRTTLLEYDALGRTVSEKRPEGVVKTSNFEWSDVGVYSMAVQCTNAPQQITFFDEFNREVRIGDMRFSGKWRYVDYRYDRYGRKTAESLPYTGASAANWNLFEYDRFNRLLTETEASGKTTTYAYDGLTVTEEKNNIVKTTTTDESGLTVKVSDPGGEIQYLYRADRQLSAVLAPGNVSTELGYDAVGRRIAIKDPSFGLRRYAYAYKDGCSVVTETDADGRSVTTSYDMAGRIAAVERPEFNTTYNYSQYGYLQSVKSTNGTSTAYGYDVYGRLSGIRENAPDNEYVIKRIHYDESGYLAREDIYSKSNMIKLSYSYQNGTCDKIMLNDTVTAWQLRSENGMGQPVVTVTNGFLRRYTYDEYGHPTDRLLGGVQRFGYDFDPHTGNLLSRTDRLRNLTERFAYDNLNRLVDENGAAVDYDNAGNQTHRDGVCSVEHNSAPGIYQASAVNVPKELLPTTQDIAYTSFCRPDSIVTSPMLQMSAQGISIGDIPIVKPFYNSVVRFVYNHNGERVKSYGNRKGTAFTHYYIGDIYERETESDEEWFYIAGNAATAPLVYARREGEWRLYNICRDYLGSVTGIVDDKQNLVAEYSYDAWGRFRSPSTHKALPSDSISPMFGRGYCGHEYMVEHKLYNMNARLYDPVLARFLSPDPYVQAPDFTPSLNRYAYAFNNPFSYTDPDGEFFFAAISGLVKGIKYRKNIFKSMWSAVKNRAMIFVGLYALDKNKNFWGKTWQLISRFTWEAPQTVIGEGYSSLSNIFDDVDVVKHYRGATFVVREKAKVKNGKGVTFGNYINIWDSKTIPHNSDGKFDPTQPYLDEDPSTAKYNGNYLYMHEYGHYLQSQIWGPIWLLSHGLPSLFNQTFHDKTHFHYWTETDANRHAAGYFIEHENLEDWVNKRYPLHSK